MNLETAINKALESYQTFTNRPAPDDAKDFKAYHMACKAALAHLEALKKLEKLSQDNASTAPTAPDLSDIIREAKAELVALESEMVSNALDIRHT